MSDTLAYLTPEARARVRIDAMLEAAGFARDVREIGHFGTGDLELRIGSLEDLDRAKPLIARSYDAG